MSIGPIMLDLVGTQISQNERDLLLNPGVGGVILFTRNFDSVAQLTDLVSEIHDLRSPHLLVAVDHEGGRVQRFHEGFTRLPPAALVGEVFNDDADKGRELAELAGWLMAVELRSVGVDFSFAPVLDLAHGFSGVIGDRAFHSKSAAVATLSYAYMHGMSQAGMQAVAKHFPGHGGVEEDSHMTLPTDYREFNVLLKEDISPFDHLIKNDLAAIMPAHVIYKQVDDLPAGYSKIWLQDILRERLNFQGVIFSDDLSMEAAGTAGSYAERAQMALDAGCDMILICNHPDGAKEVIEHLAGYSNPTSQLRLMRMHGAQQINRTELTKNGKWQDAVTSISKLDQSPWIEMDV